MDFKPRRGRASYIKLHKGRYYYRRDIPKAFRGVIGKTAWNIPLEGKTDAARKAEAGAIAHHHNKQMTMDMDSIVGMVHNPIDETLSLRLDFSPETLPVNNKVPPLEFYRDGKLIRTYKFAFSTDPEFIRDAERDGYLAMSAAEMMEQARLGRIRLDGRKAVTPDGKELAKLKTNQVITKIKSLAASGGHTLRSILPKMHQYTKPREPTKKKHVLAVNEFIGLHGNLPLLNITRQHVADYVEYVAGMSHNGKPLAPTTISQRLETISAILQYATSVNTIPFNPAIAVKAPKDARPFTSKTYKAFEKPEVVKLVLVATDIWSTRRYQNEKTRRTRKTDFITALHMLAWTGARPEEICQLRMADIDMTKMYLTITNIEDDDDLRNRFTKNEHSVRTVPIHSSLEARLVNHLSHIRQASNGALLFPSFEPALETGRYARPISNEWTAHLRKRITDDPQKVLYSLRHSWAAESKRVGMPEWVRNLIMGHANQEASLSAGRYGSSEDNLDIKREWLEKMSCIRG